WKIFPPTRCNGSLSLKAVKMYLLVSNSIGV
ncbi:MAG: hypothetical protein ACJAXH_003484, partial [Colwellia sp.]